MPKATVFPRSWRDVIKLFSMNPGTSGNKPRVLFVGGFSRAARDGALGGQAYACQTLIASTLNTNIEWVLIDSTQQSVPPPSLPIRAWYALRRLLKFGAVLATPVHTVLLFSSFDAFAIAEKGLMCRLARLRGIRVVWSLRSEIRIKSAQHLMSSLCRILLNGASVLLCQTDDAARRLRALLPHFSGEMCVIPNWIDASQYPVVNADHQVTSFLFLGWCEIAKGVHDLIMASRILAEEGVPFRLMIAGGGSQLEWVRQRVEEWNLSSRIAILGWVAGEAKERLLRDADVLVLPSYSEGMPNAVLEAMTSGLAVVASPVGGVPVLVDADVTGLLVPPGDINRLTAAMRALAQSLATARLYGARGAVKARNMHDISVIAPRIAQLLDIPSDSHG